MAKTIEGVVRSANNPEIIPAVAASSRYFGSVDLARAAGFDPASGTVDPKSGSVTIPIPAQPRGLRVHGTINGRVGASTVLTRATVASMAATIFGADKAKRAAAMARFPASGEPDAPKREDAATVAAIRDELFDGIAARSWTVESVSRKRASLL